jgi:CPA2 family monovalent cation:H+ antiporter-2
MKLHENSELAGISLANSNLRKRFGVNIVSILRGTRRLNIPGSEVRLFPGDILGVIGTDEQIAAFLPIVECNDAPVMAAENSEEVKYDYIAISPDSQWIGKSTYELELRNKFHCLLVGIERDINTFLQPDGTIKIEANDILWIAGETQSIKEVRDIAQGKK